MDPVDPPSCWSTAALGSSRDDINAKYTLSYLESFVPVYQKVNQSANSSMMNRYHAIKFAADASLAMTAGGARWSDALGKQIAETCREAAHSRRPDEMRSSAVLDHSGETKIELPSPESRTGRSSYECHTCELAGSEDCRANLDGDSAEDIGVAAEDKETDSSRVKDHSKLSVGVGDGSRLSIMRALLRRNRSKKYVNRRCWKPRATVRKARTLSKSRRRFLPRRMRTAGSQMRQDSDRRVHTGILALQRLVPGGSDMDEALLLDETADFLTFLKLQVQALQSVACAVNDQFRENGS